MSDIPPPPSTPPPSGGPEGVVPPPPTSEAVPFVIPTPMAAPPRRPSVLTTAAVAFLVLAFLHGFAALVILSLRSSSTPSPLLQASTGNHSFGVGVGVLVLGVLELLAGFLVLRLNGAGRILGLVVASLEVINGLRVLIDGQGTAVLGIGINLFLIYALATTGDVFARARRR
ncbi:MAG: hypothetical protein QOG88_1404 [Actinomycetota bacterium]|nr:hypothetical protein [Actinomycetota bacterium]